MGLPPAGEGDRTPLFLWLVISTTLLLLTITGVRADNSPDASISRLALAEDPGGQLNGNNPEISQLRFREVPLGRHRLGSSDTAFWLQVTLDNPTESELKRWFEVGQARLRHVSLYQKTGHGWQVTHGGASQPFRSRPVQTLTPVFPVTLAPGEARQFWVRVASETPVIIHPRLWTTDELLAVDSHNTQLEFFMAGAVVLMLLFGIAATLVLREPGFALFGFAALSFLLFRWSIKGVAYREFWPDSPDWALQFVGFSQAIFAILLLLLHRSLLQTRRLMPAWDRLVIFLILTFAGFAIAFLTPLPYRPTLHTMALWGISIMLISPILGYLAWKRGNAPLLGYALAGYVLPWHATKILYFSSIGWLPPLPAGFTDYAMAGSTLLASLIILTGLGVRTARLRQQQAEAADDLRETLITQVNQRTSELFQAKEMAEKTLADHRQFVAMASHELRTPLASIHAASELIDEYGRAAKDIPTAMMQQIRTSVRQTAWLLDNLLAEDKFETQGWQPNLRTVSLRPFLETILNQSSQHYQKHGFALSLHGTEAQGTFDPEMLHIALSNLVENAAKYSPAGTGIKVHVFSEGNALNFDVIDEGLGIPEAIQPDIFAKYTRGDGTDNTAGCGIGLYIVQRVARLHRGSAVIVDSGPGGTQIRLGIPQR